MSNVTVKVRSAPIKVRVAGAQGTPAVALLMKPPVANEGALSASGNSTNDGRVASDTGMAYRWTGSSWILIGKFVGDAGPQGDQGEQGPVGPPINIVESPTMPTDTTAIWIDPETGITAIYSGGGWVTQLTSSGIPNGALTFQGNLLTFQGKQLTFTS